jgi:hypothetical protein
MRLARSTARLATSCLATIALTVLLPTSAECAPEPWWLRTDLGPRDPSTPLGRMFTPSIDDATGAGGLRLSSTGSGSAASTKVIALGRAPRTVGEGDGVDRLDAFDHRGRLAEGAHTTPARADKHLPPDVIERVIHENDGRFQSCYDLGLRRNAALRGRVVVKFVIDRPGTVAFAADAGSELPDDGVVACIVRTFDTLLFPEGADDVVTVVYPLVLTPRPQP